jgi:SAM-dependent methyltransferase
MKNVLERLAWRVIRTNIVKKLIRQNTPLKNWPPERNDKEKLQPFSRDFGLERGTPVDRYYIDQFLKNNNLDIKGRVLDFGENYYTTKYGGANVEKSDILCPVDGNPGTTIIGDLATGAGLEPNTFDAVICLQTLQVIYDIKSAVRNLHGILKEGGVCLATIPSITKISNDDIQRWGDYWRLTSLCAQKIFEEVFPPENITIKSYGNVFATCSLLYGVAVEEVKKEELDYFDPEYGMLISVRAKK